jgi:hypothetical protein
MPESAARNELELIDLGEGGRIFGPEQLVQITKAASTSQMGRFETEWLAEANLAGARRSPTPRKGANAQVPLSTQRGSGPGGGIAAAAAARGSRRR